MNVPTPQAMCRLALDANVSPATVKRLFAGKATRPSIRERIELSAAKHNVELPPAVAPLPRASNP